MPPARPRPESDAWPASPCRCTRGVATSSTRIRSRTCPDPCRSRRTPAAASTSARRWQQLLLSPGDVEDIGDDQAAPVDWDKMEEAVTKAIHRLPIIERASIAGGWAGLRPLTPDDHAIIGWAPGVEGFFLAVGWEGTASSIRPPPAAWSRSGSLDGRPSMDLSLFDPARFGGWAPLLPGEEPGSKAPGRGASRARRRASHSPTRPTMTTKGSFSDESRDRGPG